MRKFRDIHTAYQQILKDVMFDSEYQCNPRGQPIREIMDYQFRILEPEAVSVVTADMERNKIIHNYTQKEMALYDSGSNLVEDFAKASKFWNKIVNPDQTTINSAYGYLIFNNKSCGNPAFESGDLELDDMTDYSDLMRTPWEWCKASLMADKDTRQALMKFNLPSHLWSGNKDVVCTLSGLWSIRNDKLNFSLCMRSSDIFLGIPFDIPWFVSLMDKMVLELQDTYPELQKGSYTHLSHSLHMYERNEEAIKKMLGL